MRLLFFGIHTPYHGPHSMIFFITAAYLLLHSIHAAPPFTPSGTDVPPVSDIVPFIAEPSSQQCTCVVQRSVFDILWSCLATIFACAWVSVHPNMPGKGESSMRVTVKRLKLMAWTIIAPEFIITWAMRQWLGARKLAKQYQKYNWTKTHGHFLQMGGFLLVEENNGGKFLLDRELEKLYNQGKIDIPEIPEDEIKDRSKGDVFSKTLVFCQTTWFVVQCVARHVQGLVITELELVTLALAILHGSIYFLWLDKPLAAQYPITVRLRETIRTRPVVEENSEPVPEDATSFYGKLFQYFIRQKDRVLETISNNPHQFTGKFIDFVAKVVELRHRKLPSTSFLIIVQVILFPFYEFLEMFSEISREESYWNGTRIGTYYAMGGSENLWITVGVVVPMTVMFGAIHCTGWAFQFHTTAEAWIWRVSSTVITVLPPMAFMYLAFSNLSPAGLFNLGICGVLYVLARLALLGEALAGMRNLPPSALVAVKWTDAFPHI